MYIMIQDPENPGRRLYADLNIVERITAGLTGVETEILDIEVGDVTTEADLSAAISADLQHVEIEPDKLKDVLRSHYRLFHISDEFYDGILHVAGTGGLELAHFEPFPCILHVAGTGV